MESEGYAPTLRLRCENVHMLTGALYEAMRSASRGFEPGTGANGSMHDSLTRLAIRYIWGLRRGIVAGCPGAAL